MIAEKNELEQTEAFGFFERRIRKEQRKKSWFRLFRDLLITAAAVFVLFHIVLGIAIVQGDSMKPTLTDGSVSFFFRLNHTYGRNDIVIFRISGHDELLMKRIVAVAGDTVDIDEETGALMINGTVLQEDSVRGQTYARENGTEFPYTVPSGCVFVLGDNREVALDSRDFGAVPVESLMGKVIVEFKMLTS